MDGAKKQLLFVDDEAMILDMFARMLHPERDKWAAHFARDVDAAMEIAATQELDAVVTDVQMPGKDGFELLRSLRAFPRTANVPTIVVTANSEPALKRRALDLGATDLLTKPFNREDLLARIRSSLRLKSYQDRIEEQVRTLDARVKERTVELEASRREIVWRLAKACEYRDDETGNHVIRVACYARALAEAIGADAEFVDALYLTSALHDVGKIGIPDSLLLKKGPLTPEEREFMQTHSVMGAEILTSSPKAAVAVPARAVHARGQEALNNPLLNMAALIAKHHHEKWNGAGYPEGLFGDAIPLAARIVALADVFDALTSERPYKPAFSKDKSRAIVREESGRHFDPALVAAFDKSRAEIDAIYADYFVTETDRQPSETIVEAVSLPLSSAKRQDAASTGMA